ncbi:helix-turn-helix protein [Krasilnikovia cinnamomea]|uniref:Helix-turn-helix protein n=1 Tax=Krasilnikovia cinnamomea TaxID=349313 RepID=A0A4V2G6P9_9ACTN|nr:helix-turn-helix transcriptional regulator [Krasilnikovia cinnamomea]RZU49506.1 helix-turn-helix protein [Krasilnikovia cinnamomea]
MTAETDSGSTVPRWQLGGALKRLREDAKLSLQGAADALEWSKQRLWRCETGQVSTHPNDVKAMCDLYEAGPELTETLKAVARQTKSKGWWHSYSDIPGWFELYLGMEGSADRLRMYEAEVVPGPLQSRHYAEAILRSGLPANTSDEAVRSLVGVRLRRQSILSAGSTEVCVIMSEAALDRSFTPDIMADQMRTLLTLAELPGVSLRVIPRNAPPTLAHGGPFVILDFQRALTARTTQPTTIYKEQPTGALYLDKPHEAETYEKIWADLDRVSLDQTGSSRLIAQRLGEMTNA